MLLNNRLRKPVGLHPLINTINFPKCPLKKGVKREFCALKININIIRMGLNERIFIVGGGLSGLTLAY